LLAVAALVCASPASAQPLTYRGFVETRGLLFPQDASNDTENAVGDFTARGEVFAEPTGWLQLAASIDLRANSHDQVDDDWTPDLLDRSLRRPPISIRRLSATVYRGPLTIDAGRQFIRWGRSDILVPTDRFAPRDYLNVVDNDFLAVNGVRGRLSHGFDSLDIVWVPVFTPSRIPLLDQRWTVLPEDLPPLVLPGENDTPGRWQAGVRWERVLGVYEFAVAYYDGFSHLPVLAPAPAVTTFDDLAADFAALGLEVPPPSIAVMRRFPGQRMIGGDGALATRWLTLKAEAGYFDATDEAIDDYVLYVLQVERQTGEWLLIGGYAGEIVTTRRETQPFAADRGIARSILASASYTIDSTRSLAFEGAVRQDADGVYVKAEYSQSHGQHWRTTVGGALIAGEDGDFLGQYRRNSHVIASLRYSF